MKLKLLQSSAFRASFLFWVSTMIANVVNWLYNVVAGRTLSREDFAVLTVFLTVYTLVVVPANALATTVSRYIALYTGKGDDDNHHRFFKHYAGLSLTLGMLGFLIFVGLAQPLKNYFGLTTLDYLLLFSPSLVLLFLVAFQRGVLKGNLAFGSVGLLLVTEALTKLLALIISPWFGWPLLTVAIISLPMSVLFSWLLSIALTRVHRPTSFQFISRPVSAFSDTYTFFGNSFSASVGTALLNSVSILMVKHYFSAAEAGIYAVLVLFGKILFFGAGGLIEISLPLIVRERAQGLSGRRQFLVLLSLVTLVAGAIYSVYFFFPVQVITFFIGEKGLVTLPYLRLYTFGIFALIIMSCVSAYNVAKKNFGPARLVLLTAGIQAVLIALYHETLWQIVQISTFTLTGLTVATIALEFWHLWQTQSKNATENGLMSIIWSYLPLRRKAGKTHHLKLPKILPGFKLEKELTVPGLKKQHGIGIYKDAKGKLFVAKIWRGTAHNADAISIKTELVVYQILNQVVTRTQPTLPTKLKHVVIPKLVYSEITPTRVVMVTEFFKGDVLREQSPNIKAATFSSVLAYIEFLSQHLSSEERHLLPKRDGKAYALLFPAIWGVAILRQPTLIASFIKAAGYFILALPELLTTDTLKLVHRDLHTHNILVSKNKVAIIDWQRAVLTFPVYEFATTLPIEINDTALFKNLVKLLEKRHSSTSQRLTKALLLNFAVHGLTANNLPSTNIERYKAMLQYALAL